MESEFDGLSFIRVCPKCAEMWHGAHSKERWLRDSTSLGIVEYRDVRVPVTNLESSEYLYEVFVVAVRQREHAGCGGVMLTEGMTSPVTTRSRHADEQPILSALM